MRSTLLPITSLALASLTLLGCETRVATDNPDRLETNRPAVIEEPRREVDADINVTGPRGGAIRVDVDGDGRSGALNDDVDIRVDANRPIRRRDDDVRIRETPRGVKVDVRD